MHGVALPDEGAEPMTPGILEPRLEIRVGLAEHPADVEQAKRESHDLLIASLGPRRVSGVAWRTYHGTALIRSVLEGFEVDLNRGELASYLERWPDATLVLAIAAAMPGGVG